ncbi:hypothetical protein HK096_010003, partial [Nowakowskiella sp. JEL0078]
MELLAKEHDKVVERQLATQKSTQTALDAILASLSDAKHALEALRPSDSADSCISDRSALSAALSDSLKKSAAELNDSHKDLLTSLTKYSKAVDKRFKQQASMDLDSLWDTDAADGKEDCLVRVISTHLVREGRFELAETFEKDAKRLKADFLFADNDNVAVAGNDDKNSDDVVAMDVEPQVDVLAELRTRLAEVHEIVDLMNEGHLDRAILWAQTN